MECWPLPRSRCCRCGPAYRCCCPTSRPLNSPSCAASAVSWSAASGGRCRPRVSASTVDDVDEELVDAAIAGHLRVKRRGEHPALPHRDGVSGRPGQYLHTLADPLHPRRADEYPAHRFVEAAEPNIAFERVELTTKSVAPHRDID